MFSTSRLMVSTNNLFRLSRDIEKLRQLLGFLCHQSANPGKITTPQVAYDYFPTVSKASNIMAKAMGYEDHASLLAAAKTFGGTHYPSFTNEDFKSALTALVLEEVSHHYQTMPRSPDELVMITEMIDSLSVIISDENGRSREVVVGGNCSGKTYYLVQWLVAYAESIKHIPQIPLVVVGLPSLFDNLNGQRPDLFNSQTVEYIQIEQSGDNFPTSPTGAAITFIEIDAMTIGNFNDERLYANASILADREEPMWAVFDETMAFVPVAVAFKNSDHNILATEQRGYVEDGQTLFSPSEFVWRFVEPITFTHFMHTIGAWEPSAESSLADNLMPPHPSGSRTRLGHCLVKANGLLSLPFQWDDSLLYPELVRKTS